MTGPPLVELQDLEIGYAGRPVVAGMNLRVAAGEIVTIIGTSGSGKSTLLRTIAGLLAPLSGTVRLFGEDLYTLPAARRAHLMAGVGLLFQEGALFGSMSVLDNVMFPGRKLTDDPDDLIRELALTKLARVDVAELAPRMPHDISGGQAKRVALARATALDPRLLLCDEPTSGLDPINAALLTRLLARAREDQGATVVLVTHDIETVMALADRVVVIASGGVHAVGDPGSLARSADPHLTALFHRGTLPFGTAATEAD